MSTKGEITIDGRKYTFTGDSAKSIMMDLQAMAEREAIQTIDKRFDRLERMLKLVFCFLILPPPVDDPNASYIANGFQGPAGHFFSFEEEQNGKDYRGLLEELLQIDKYRD